MSLSKPVHVLVDKKILCGTKSGWTVLPNQAKHVTCRRCLASLRKVGS